MRADYGIGDVAPYINWIYFYHAWGMSRQPQKEQQRLRAEAEERLVSCEGRYQTDALCQVFDAYSDGDDIVIGRREPESGQWKTEGETRLPFLRQQQSGSNCLCLSDFVAPHPSCHAPVRHSAKLGVFATTVDMGFETDFDDDPYEKMLMQLLADRLAEATAEKLHEQVRKTFWGYAPDEQLAVSDLHQERYQGIRPAVGYPSLPDTSLNFLVDQLLGLRQIGIRLTESGAMKPHASVSGLMLSNPRARYFTVGKIGDDQLRDYARRRGLPVELMRRFLAANL